MNFRVMRFYDSDTHEIFEATDAEFRAALDDYNDQWQQDWPIHEGVPIIFRPAGIVLKGHRHFIHKLDEEYVVIKFEDKYVHFRWTDELKGKKCFVANDMATLRRAFENGSRRTITGEYSEANPFTAQGFFPFAYYDPNYDCKIAFNEGKTIQFKSHVDGAWCNCGDMEGLWDDNYEYRIKPSKPALQWTDLKIGDVIKSTNRKAMVVDIVTDEDAFRHVCVGCRWLTNDELESWEKV